MIRNLKTLGLALVALFAMSAVVASAASAQEEGVLTSETGEAVTLTGEETGEGSNTWTIGESSIQCPGSVYTGHAIDAEDFLPNSADEITLTPHYRQTNGETATCNASGGLSMTIQMNGCDYRLYDFTSVEEKETYAYKTNIVCPEGKQIELLLYSGHGHSLLVCTWTIAPQTELTGLHATNLEGGYIGMAGSLGGFTINQAGLCGSGEFEGAYDLDVIVWGHNEDEEAVGLSLSDGESPSTHEEHTTKEAHAHEEHTETTEAHTHAQHTTEEAHAHEESTGTLLSATGTPVTLTAEESGGAEANRFTVGNDWLQCPGSSYTGHNDSGGFISDGAGEFKLTPHFLQVEKETANCDATSGLSGTVTMGGCSFRVYEMVTTEAEGTYAVKTDLVCPKGHNVDLHIYLGHGHGTEVCHETITPGTGYSGLQVSNGPSGHLSLLGTVGGLDVHKFGLCGEETSEGKVDVNVTVGAHNEAEEEEGVAIGDKSAPEGLVSNSEAPVTLTGEDTGEGSNRFTVAENIIECPGSAYTGHAVQTQAQTEEESSHQFLSNGSSEITMTPHYKQTQEGGTPNCDVTGSLSMTTTMNGCDYRLYDFTTGSEAGTYEYQTDIVCPEGQQIELHVYAGHGHGFQVCKQVIPPDTELTGLHATNGESGHINLTGSLSGFTVQQSGLCGATEAEGEFDIDVTVGGHNEDEETEGIALSD